MHNSCVNRNFSISFVSAALFWTSLNTSFAHGAAGVPSFRNHVLPVLTKAGCNGGSCHGALAGKGGLKLTLRGFDPEADYNTLTRQTFGRRVIKGDPEHSLLLLKPTMTIGHGGGERIKKGSGDYQVVANWIKAGAPAPRQDDARLQKLDVSPAMAIVKPGQKQQITVKAQ